MQATHQKLNYQQLSLQMTHPLHRARYCMDRDGLPRNVGTEYLLPFWGVQSCQVGLSTHKSPIKICAADEDLPSVESSTECTLH